MKNNLRKLTLIGVLSALSFLLMMLEFPVPGPWPVFLKIDPSDIPALFTGIFVGPVPAITIELIKNILHGILIPKDAPAGEIANFFAGIGYILPIAWYTSVIRKEFRTWSTAKTLLRFVPIFAIATVSMTVVMALVNYFITFPIYYFITTHAEKIALIGPISLFNLFKGFIVAAVAFAMYVPLKKMFVRYFK